MASLNVILTEVKTVNDWPERSLNDCMYEDLDCSATKPCCSKKFCVHVFLCCILASSLDLA